MGFLFKFLIFFIAIYYILRGVAAWLLRKRHRENRFSGSPYTDRRRTEPKQPETQKERIIDYHRKKFESTEVEDADFIEYKEK